MSGDVDESWTVLHFSQANPKGAGQSDVPSLLRRVADTIEKQGAIDVQDVVFHAQLDEAGDDWPTMTVYYHRADEPQQSPRG